MRFFSLRFLRKFFRRPDRKKLHHRLRSHNGLIENLEERCVLTTSVSVEADMSQITEGDLGVFRLTRNGGDTSDWLDISFQIQGTAEGGNDYDESNFMIGWEHLPIVGARGG